jgi:hypothetical protein
MLLLIASLCAVASIPPAVVARRQELAVHVYCAHWRRAKRDRALEGDEVKKVIIDLQVQYPTASTECRLTASGSA